MSIFILQNSILEINESNYQDVASQIISSKFLEKDEELQEIINFFIFAIRIRTKKMSSFVQVLQIIISKQPKFKNLLIERILNYSPIFSLKVLSEYHLLRLLLLQKVCTIEDVCNVIVSKKQTYTSDFSFLYTQTAIFGEFLEEFNPDFFDSTMNTFLGSVLTTDHFLDPSSSEHSPDHVFQQWLKFIQRTKKNWELQNECFNLLAPINSLAPLIRMDDFDSFQEKASDVLFDINDLIESSIFEPSFFLKNDPSLIQYSAFNGSIKIFKFLFLNNADLSYLDTSGRSLVHYAIAGSNFEIIHIIEQKSISFKGSLPTAGLFCLMDIIEWLTTTEKCILTEVDPEGYSLFGRFCQSDYINGIQYCIDNAFDFSLVSTVKHILIESPEAELFIRENNLLTDEELNEMKENKEKPSFYQPSFQG